MSGRKIIEGLQEAVLHAEEAVEDYKHQFRNAGVEVALLSLPPKTMWAIGNMEDGPFARVILPHPNGTYTGGYGEAFADTPAEALRQALASARGDA